MDSTNYETSVGSSNVVAVPVRRCSNFSMPRRLSQQEKSTSYDLSVGSSVVEAVPVRRCSSFSILGNASEQEDSSDYELKSDFAAYEDPNFDESAFDDLLNEESSNVVAVPVRRCASFSISRSSSEQEDPSDYELRSDFASYEDPNFDQSAFDDLLNEGSSNVVAVPVRRCASFSIPRDTSEHEDSSDYDLTGDFSTYQDLNLDNSSFDDFTSEGSSNVVAVPLMRCSSFSISRNSSQHENSSSYDDSSDYDLKSDPSYHDLTHDESSNVVAVPLMRCPSFSVQNFDERDIDQIFKEIVQTAKENHEAMKAAPKTPSPTRKPVPKSTPKTPVKVSTKLPSKSKMIPSPLALPSSPPSSDMPSTSTPVKRAKKTISVKRKGRQPRDLIVAKWKAHINMKIELFDFEDEEESMEIMKGYEEYDDCTETIDPLTPLDDFFKLDDVPVSSDEITSTSDGYKVDSIKIADLKLNCKRRRNDDITEQPQPKRRRISL